MIYRCIAPQWLVEEQPGIRKVLEGEFLDEEIQEYNKQGYNIYFLPNSPSSYDPNVIVDGSHIDTFDFVFFDMDLKAKDHKSKEAFLSSIQDFSLKPTLVDSGNGIHGYFRVSDLDAMSFLRLQRRLVRKFKTDEAVAKIYQLMRVPGTLNNKDKHNPKLCTVLDSTDQVYTCEELDKALPCITDQDEKYCIQHYNKTYGIGEVTQVDDKIPAKFAKLLRNNKEVKEIWSGNTDDRSKSDYRLGHLMLADGFTKSEALSVLVNTAKALERGPSHRVSYAEGIVDKVWAFEQDQEADKLSYTVREILQRRDANKGERFSCWRYIDATEYGFRLGHVIGLVAGSGVGKTSMALNMFLGFVKQNPDYTHFFVTLEQPASEIANRWKTLCAGDTRLFDKVHIIDNYESSGQFRHLSLGEIKEYILKFQQTTDRKVGCVVIDHIAALKMKDNNGENQRIADITHQMKAFAIQTNTLLVMQSQAPREKAGIGDLELNKDAAYGSVLFESYCDFLITIWQPLKRCYVEGAPLITAFKFCKIRHKKQGHDNIVEDAVYRLVYNAETEHFRELTQDEEQGATFWENKASNLRKRDKRDGVAEYQSIKWAKE